MPSNFFNLINGLPVNSNTIGGMSDLENIDSNLYYLIKETILPINGYTTTVTETILPGNQEINQETNLIVTPFQSRFIDWCYYNPDPINPSLTGLVTNPILSMSGNLEHIDYFNGKVYYSGIQTLPLTVKYSFYNVFVQDGSPEQYDDQYLLETLRLPAISINSIKRFDSPKQIGGEYSNQRFFTINITANSDAQKYDLLDIIENSLKYSYTNTIDYKLGFPTLFNGDKYIGLNRSIKWKPIYFQNSTSRTIRNPLLQDKLRHQAELDLVIYTND